MTPGAQAVYDELDGRKGVLDGIDDEIIEEICEATAAAVIGTLGSTTYGDRVRHEYEALL
jgi:hypothetical protein